ncbi:GNAT family N-acetyltransferase [Verrucomicrobiota bacterium sgz303538]
MQLDLPRFSIRSFRAGDEHSLAEHIGTHSVARNMSLIPHPYTLANAKLWIEIASTRRPETNFAITMADKVVGGIGLCLMDPERIGVNRYNAELGYWLSEAFWGRGFMTEAVLAFTDWGFTNLDLVRIHAAVYARNPASARVLEKAGFEYEGRLRAAYYKEGEFIHGLLYAKVRYRSSG